MTESKTRLALEATGGTPGERKAGTPEEKTEIKVKGLDCSLQQEMTLKETSLRVAKRGTKIGVWGDGGERGENLTKREP